MRASNNTFSSAPGDLIQTNALGTSTLATILKNNNLTSNNMGLGGGVTLSGGGNTANIDADYLINNNDFEGAVASALTVNFGSFQGTGNGTISNNVIGTAVAGSGSSTGSGMMVGCEKNGAGAGNITHTANINNNTIRGIAGFAGLDLFANRGANATDNARSHISMTDNVVNGLSGFATNAVNALVGGSALSGDFSYLCTDKHGNTFDASAAPFGGNAILYDQISEDAQHNVPDHPGSGNGEFAFQCAPGTASADLHTHQSGVQGNTLINGPFPSHPGGVDASLVCGLTGSGSTCP